MSAIKYTFDDDFENDAGGSLSQSKIEEIRRTAFEQGQEAGRAEILGSLEQGSNELLQNILTAAQNLANRQDEQISLMNKEAAKLAFTIIEKLAPALVEKTPLSEIELLVEQCLRSSPLEPRLVIRVDETILPGLQDRLDNMKHAQGFPGQVVLISSPMAHISDCRVEWANGGVDRDFDSLMATVENTVQLFIDAPEGVNISPTSGIDPQNGIISETISG